MISLGRGMQALSIVMHKKTPKYPNEEIIWIIKPPRNSMMLVNKEYAFYL